jgi:hypothetical protein
MIPAAGGEARTLRQYASSTWASFVAMTDQRSGLPADSLGLDGTRSVQTSTTNIAAYMWSAVVAENLDIIGRHELVSRLSTTLGTLEHTERHASFLGLRWDRGAVLTKPRPATRSPATCCGAPSPDRTRSAWCGQSSVSRGSTTRHKVGRRHAWPSTKPRGAPEGRRSG